MDDDGQPRRSRELHLLNEDLLLQIPRRLVVVIVESDFTQAARQRLRIDRPADTVRRLVRIGRECPGRVRVHTNRESNPAPPGRHFARLRDLRLVVRGQDDERVRDAGRGRPRDDVIEVAGELWPRDVAVAVDQRALPTSNSQPPTSNSQLPIYTVSLELGIGTWELGVA